MQTQELPVEEKQARLRAVYDRIHAEQPERSALCLSGGGIRSAIFSLGILQGLARHGLLGGFDYLSTVSGGGFVGGWLSAWIRNHPQGVAGVVEALGSRPNLTLNPEPRTDPASAGFQQLSYAQRPGSLRSIPGR